MMCYPIRMTGVISVAESVISITRKFLLLSYLNHTDLFKNDVIRLILLTGFEKLAYLNYPNRHRIQFYCAWNLEKVNTLMLTELLFFF